MWAFFWAVLAYPGTPPNIQLDEIEKWEDAAEQLLDMPSGCWEWVGQASWDWHTGKYGKTRGDAVFAGKTNDGDWGEIALQPLGELQQRTEREREHRIYADQARFVPMVGRLPGGRVVVAGEDEGDDAIEDAEALNVLRQVLARIGGEAFTSWAEWDEARGGVVLNRAIPLAANRKEEVKVEIFFPNGGPVPSQLDVRFPRKFKAVLRGNEDDTQLGKIRMGLFAFTIKDAEVHVRGLIRGNRVFPSSEAFRLRFGFFGIKYHGAQTVVYKKVTRCATQRPAQMVTAHPAAEAVVQAGALSPDDEAPLAPVEGDDAAEAAADEVDPMTRPGAGGGAGSHEELPATPEPTAEPGEAPVHPGQTAIDGADAPAAPADAPPAHVPERMDPERAPGDGTP